MRTYEIVCIFHPDLDETAVTSAVEKIKTWITDVSGSINKIDLWGKKRLAYAINKQREGQYVLVETQLDPATSSTIDRNLRFLEPVMRYMITLAD